jgi:glycosyltransferase involved in cell wall biosynthesis
VRVLMLDHPYAWKGTAEGHAVVQAVRESVPDLRLVLFSAKSRQASVACDEFHPNPPQSALARLYSSCPIFLCPSWDEGSGLPSMEAMLCGAAVVTYDNGGSRDYAVDGKTAFVAHRRDRAMLTEKLRSAVTDAAQRERIAEAGAAFVRAMPDWQTQTARLARIFDAF